STYRRCPSAYTVSNTSDDLPEPDTPVTTVSWLCGIASDTSFRLWTRAPRITMESSKGNLRCYEEPQPCAYYLIRGEKELRKSPSERDLRSTKERSGSDSP